MYSVKTYSICFKFLALVLVTASCSSDDKEQKDEQLRIELPGSETQVDTTNVIRGNASMAQLQTYPSQVILTGLPQHRLVPLYKGKKQKRNDEDAYSSYGRYYYYEDSERETHYMPGIDLLHGYNLLNIAHYDFTTEKTSYLFDQPVLIKSLYYPSFEQDTLNNQPINRNYYLVSVYDQDTNLDTLINKKDLRRFYSFNASNSEKTQLIPTDYSVERSQYDAMNDVMYIFARHDANRSGATDKTEPLHIFWIALKKPAKAKRLY